MRSLTVAAFLLVPTIALAQPAPAPAPVDKDVTLTTSELQSLIDIAVSQDRAAQMQLHERAGAALAKVQKQIAPKKEDPAK